MNLWKVNIVVGRFQPLTLGHIACAKEAERRFDRPTVLCMINTPATKTDEKHPFPTDVFYQMYWNVCKRYKFIEDIVIVPSADIVKISQILAEKGLCIGSWTCGTDRYNDYKRMVDKYSAAANLPDDFELIEVKRTAEDISATKARQALMDGDRKTFNKITPFGDLSGYLKGQSSFDTFRKYVLFQVHENVNESFLLGGIAAAAFISFAFIPLFNKTKGFLSKFFGSFFNDDDEDKKDKKDKKKKDDDNGSSRSTEDILDILTKAADDANKKEKDPEVQAKNQAAIDLLTKSSVDEDGNPIPVEERLKRIEASLPEGTSIEDWKKQVEQEIQKNTDDATKAKLNKMLSEITPEDIAKAREESRKKAIEIQIKDAEEAKEKLDKRASEIEKEIKDLEGKDDEESKKKLEDLKKEQEDIKQQQKKNAERLESLHKAKNTTGGQGEPDPGEPGKSEPDPGEPGKGEPDPGEPGKGEPDPGKLDDDIKAAEDNKKKLDDQAAEIEKKIKDLEGKDDEESKKKLEDLKKEQEDIKKQQKENDSKLEELKKAKGKQGEPAEPQTKEIDGETFTLKDGKWVNKDGETMEEEEITDPNDPDKKIKVKAYTGPRGGKYYWPDGKPKTPENKVYIQESFVDYLYRMLG